MLLSRRRRRWLHLTFVLLAFLQLLLLSWRCRRRLHLTFALLTFLQLLLLGRRRRRWLYLAFALLTLLQLLLSRRCRWWLYLTLLWRGRTPPRWRLFLLFLICLGHLRDHEHAIEWRGLR